MSKWIAVMTLCAGCLALLLRPDAWPLAWIGLWFFGLACMAWGKSS